MNALDQALNHFARLFRSARLLRICYAQQVNLVRLKITTLEHQLRTRLPQLFATGFPTSQESAKEREDEHGEEKRELNC